MAANNMTLGERWRLWTGTNADHYVSLKTLLDLIKQFDRTMVTPVQKNQIFDAVAELYAAKKQSASQPDPESLTALFVKTVDRYTIYPEGKAKATLMTALFEYVHNVLFNQLRVTVAGKQGEVAALADVKLSLPHSNVTVMTYATSRTVVPVRFNERFIEALLKLYKAALYETDGMISRYVKVGAEDVLVDTINSKIMKAQQELVQLHTKYNNEAKSVHPRLLAKWQYVTNVEALRSDILHYANRKCQRTASENIRGDASVKGSVKSNQLQAVVKATIRRQTCSTITVDQLAKYVSIQIEKRINAIEGDYTDYSRMRRRSPRRGLY